MKHSIKKAFMSLLVLLTVALSVQSSFAGYCSNSSGGWRAVDTLSDCTADETYSGTQPPIVSIPPVIQSITMRQARLQLLAMGQLDAVTNAIAAMTGADGQAAQIAWQYSSTVERSNALFLSIKTTLGFTDAQVETFFNDGSKL